MVSSLWKEVAILTLEVKISYLYFYYLMPWNNYYLLYTHIQIKYKIESFLYLKENTF